MPDSSLVLLDVLEEHLEELDLLWERRQRALDSPDYTIASFATLEERMAAHLEGLRVGAELSRQIARQLLPKAKGGGAFAAAYVLFAFGDAGDERAVVDALEAGDADAAEGLRHAFRHRASDRLLGELARLVRGPDAPASVAALDALAFRRRPANADFSAYLTSDDPWVRSVAWSAAARSGPSLSASALTAGFEDRDPAVAKV